MYELSAPIFKRSTFSQKRFGSGFVNRKGRFVIFVVVFLKIGEKQKKKNQGKNLGNLHQL